MLSLSSCGTTSRRVEPETSVELSAPVELGEEYTEYRRDTQGRSPELDRKQVLRFVLLYIPNRLLDFWDIFRLDVGLGASYGGSLKLSSFLQFAYRKVEPFSLRLGPRGRELPGFFEERDEIGIGSDVRSDPQRRTGDFELGAGVDLLVLGLYGGVCLDETLDFVLGIFGVDVLEDDFG